MGEAPGEAPQMRWWGWGEESHPPALGASALSYLREHVGIAPRPRPPVALAGVSLPRARLSDEALHALRAVLGEQGVRSDHRERVLHAAGKGYPDLVRLRAGAPEGAPDAVLHPRDRAQVRALLDVCARHALAVVPFGGGTSVVGGLAPLHGEGHRGVVALALSALAGVREIDRESLTVTAHAGTRALALERELARHGLTLGHFPQSFEYVSLGGCAATRSAGQASTGYGRFEELVQGLVLVAPAGEIELAAVPATAAGPELRRVAVGSEGTLGVIAELALRVAPAPATQRCEGVFFRDFAAGVQALRALAQEHAAPAIARLSDEAETAMSLAFAGGGLKRRLGDAYLALRRYRGGCLAILGFEGSHEEVALRRRRALELVRRHEGLALGASPGQAWLAQRFAAPYLRDELLTHGVMVETLETATRWSNLQALHEAVGSAIARALATPPAGDAAAGLVMCHVSHLYETGASLYFTFLARQREGQEIEQWQAVKRAASEAILAGGGTITHHHAVGRDHAPWFAREVGGEGVAALRALKAQLDPAGIMNPGKLLSGAGQLSDSGEVAGSGKSPGSGELPGSGEVSAG